MSGVLYVVATPIGNLDDWSPRAATVLKQVAVIAAEDTRHSARLMQHFGISTPLIALHDHNEAVRIESVIARLQAGDSVALISDAGTPLVSDPGFRLVAAAQAAKLKISPVPGACAAIAALSVAGMPSDRFVFEGFLPAKAAARVARLEALVREARSLIFYEAPHRIVECLEDMCSVFGDARQITMARELTKTFETVRQSSLGDLLAWVRSDSNQQRGEFVLVVAGAEPDPDEALAEAERVLRVLMTELPLKQAASLAATITGCKKNLLYERGLQLKG